MNALILRRAAATALHTAAATSTASRPAAAVIALRRRAFSDAAGGDMGGDGSGNITYSGGQATQGQGGFYGAGGARRVTQ